MRIVSVPAFLWVKRCEQIRDFLLNYRDCATREQNTWAQGYIDGMLEKVEGLEARAEMAVKLDRPNQDFLEANYTGEMQFPANGGRPLP